MSQFVLTIDVDLVNDDPVAVLLMDDQSSLDDVTAGLLSESLMDATRFSVASVTVID